MSYRPEFSSSFPQTMVFAMCLMVLLAFTHIVVHAAPVAVRFQEGKVHGFLLVRSMAGEVIAHGELTQTAKEGKAVESQLTFTFNDGSVHDEKVAYAQQGVFTLISYHLVQRGPFFPEQLNVRIDRGTGEYKARIQAGEDEEEEVRTGTFDMPKDVYNGMIVTLLQNLPKGTSETVRILSFRPEPEIITLELLPKGEGRVRIGDRERPVLKYSFKPDIGIIRKWLGRLTGQLPDHFHYHCWILAEEVPSFVHYEGPLQLMGPIVRIELISPNMPSNN